MSDDITAGARVGEAAPAVVRYTLDAARSTFTVQAFASGLLSGFGHNPTIGIRDYAGDARFADAGFAGLADLWNCRERPSDPKLQKWSRNREVL